MNGLLSERFDRLLAENRDAIFGHALRLTRDRDLAEDLVQTAILRAMRAFDRFDGDNFRAWILTIVTNLHINERKRLARTEATLLENEDEIAAADPSPYGALTLREVSPEVMEAIAELPSQIARTFSLVEIAGLSHNEVAVAEDIPVGTVQSRTFRARTFLRERLLDYARAEHGVE